MNSRRFERGYLLMEALVYIGVLFLLLGVATAAMYRLIDNSVALRRNADDIIRAVHAGERWRADLRLASRSVRWEQQEGMPVLRLEGARREVDYRFAQSAIYRRIDQGPWSSVLDGIESSDMKRESRPHVTVWRWELELQSKAHGSFRPGRVRPLFTFLGVEPAPTNP